MTEGFIPSHGGYQELQSYRRSLVVFQATQKFCRDFFGKFDRTVDQMVQAARSGKQNIIEGSMASGTSKETELKLTNVARASLEELLEDYRDFMRDRMIAEWDKNHRYAKRLSVLCREPDADYETFRAAVEHSDPAIRANAIAGLIKVTNYLLDQQLRKLEQDFLKEGGLRERMTRARLDARDEQRRRKNDSNDGNDKNNEK
jgi:four helix bundle suffix protein